MVACHKLQGTSPVINECKPASLLFEYAYEDFNLDSNLTSVEKKMCILKF